LFLQTLGEVILVFGLGICGWQLFAKLRFPAPEIIGPVILIGALRISQLELPPAPEFLFPAAQVIIGIFVGSMLDKDALRDLRPMVSSALVIIVWTLSMIFLIGFFLHRFSVMDLPTAMLSASMGGLPEITVLAVASGASAAVVIVMQMIRMVGTVMLFPVLLNWLEKKNMVPVYNQGNSNRGNREQADQNYKGKPAFQKTYFRFNLKLSMISSFLFNQWQTLKTFWKEITLTLAVATAGGLLLHNIGVPAGLMVGSTFAVATASIAGLPIRQISPRVLSLLLVAVGVNVSDNITIDTIHTMANPNFLIPILIASAVMFASSFGIAWVISRMTSWDYPTSFLAAAPGGFTVMTAMAIKHGLNPIRVSMLHLCRLFSIKIFLPLYFMTLF